MDILQRCTHPFLESVRSKANLPGLQGLGKLLISQLHTAPCGCSTTFGALGIKESQNSLGWKGTLKMIQFQPCHPHTLQDVPWDPRIPCWSCGGSQTELTRGKC